MNNNSKGWNIACIVFWVCQFIAQAAAAGYIVWLDMLPVKYLAAVIGVLVLMLLITGLLMFCRRKRGHYETGEQRPGKVRRVIAMVLAVLMMAGSVAVCYVLGEVYHTMSDITQDDQEPDGVTMAVYILADSPAQTLLDAAEFTFGVVDGYEQARTQAFVKAVNRETGREVALVSFGSVTDMLDALYSGDVQTVILNTAYVQVMEDNELYTDFSDVTRILFSQVVEEEALQQQETTEHTADSTGETDETQEQTQTEKRITRDPFIVYISGSDTRNFYLTTSRSDVNILMVVNPQTKQILLVNTPRDYYIPNPSGGGALDKLTHCGIYGIDCSMQALGDLYGVEVDYYAQINFTGFETLIDAIGGIEVYSDWNFSTGTYSFRKGINYLNGAKALAFARERHHLPGGDNGRGQNQMRVISAVVQKATTGTTIIGNYSAILKSVEGMFKTDISTQQISQLVKMQLGDLAQWDVFSYAVTGTGDSRITYSMPGLYAYVMWPNDSDVAHASDLINMILTNRRMSEDDI